MIFFKRNTSNNDEIIGNLHHQRLVLLTKQLYKEFDLLLFRNRLKLRKPIIKIEKLTNRWGAWDSISRSITINQSLFENHSWDVVIEVLKHEVAHQIVQEIFLPQGLSKPHGILFIEACNMLGVASWAKHASCELPLEIVHWKKEFSRSENHRLLKKAEKLLSLATSSNEHEALLAMKKVQELYAKYNLETASSDTRDQMVYLIVDHKKKKISQSDSIIFSILNESFFVQIVYGDLFDPVDLTSYKIVEILGSQENVLMAEYVYYFLKKKCELLWKEYQKQNPKEDRSKRSYILGVLAGFREKTSFNKLSSNKTMYDSTNEVSTNALIKTANDVVMREVSDYVSYRHPRIISKTRYSSGHLNYNSYNKGFKDGKQIVLSKGISSKTCYNSGIYITSAKEGSSRHN